MRKVGTANLVDAAVGAGVQVLDWPASSVVNVCDDEPARGDEWVPVFCQAVGAPAPPLSGGSRPGRARGASNTHAREILDWTPTNVTWREGFLA
jgi:nucleoside-diphosphate-sugar epimerase